MKTLVLAGLASLFAATASAQHTKRFAAQAPLVADGRRIADVAASVELNYDGRSAADGTYGNTITAHDQGRVSVQGDGSTNGPWVDLEFVDGFGGSLHILRDFVAPVFECGGATSQVHPEDKTAFRVGLAPEDWARLAEVRLVPHGAWPEEACR